MGGGEILKKGMLIKSPPLETGALKMWRKRWFVLLSSKVLEYYKSEGGEQKGVINLEDCHSVNSNLSHKRYKHVFNIETKERVYFLVAKSQSDMETWVEALCKVCGLHTDNTPLLYAVPPCASSKTKGPNITQPVYATTTRDTSAVHPSNAVDSVYALAAKSEYMQHGLLQNTVSVPPNFPSSDVPLRELGNRTSTTSTEGDVARNRLSEMALFSPRPGDGVGFLASDPLAKSTAMYATPPVVSKAKAATLAPNRLPDCSAGLEYRSHTNVATYGGRYQQSQGRLQISNGCMSASAAGRGLPSNTLTPGLSRIRDFTPDPLPAILDRDSAARDEGYGVLHMPPPIDRSTKPFQQPPPTIDRGLKPVGQSVDPNSSDSSEGGLDPDELPAYTKLAEEDSGGRGEDAGETQFNVAEIPRVTLRTTKYTQVDFDPHIRRPVPLPRKRSSLPAMTPKPSQRINYTDVDIVATNQLSDHLNRQMTVRGAEQKALAEKHYVNVDRSGSVDDETDPDYYTHMRDLCFGEAEEPYFSTQKLEEGDT